MDNRQRVLIVDDDPKVMLAVKAALEEMLGEGYRIDGASHPEEAIAMQKENDYDYAMIDLQMPVLSGSDLANILRMEGAGPKIYFVSGSCDVSVYQKALGIPIEHFFEKPFNYKLMEGYLREHMRPKIKTRHARLILEYDTVKGFAFIREQDEKGVLSLHWKLIGGSVEDKIEDCMIKELHEELMSGIDNRIKGIRPYSVVHEKAANVVTHYYAGKLQAIPEEEVIEDPLKRGFIMDEGRKVTKLITFFTEGQIAKRARNKTNNRLGRIYHGATLGIADYKRLKSNDVNLAIRLPEKTREYIARKTGLLLDEEAILHSWTYHQRTPTPAKTDNLGSVLLCTSHMWHYVQSRLLPLDASARKEYLEDFAVRELPRKIPLMVNDYKAS